MEKCEIVLQPMHCAFWAAGATCKLLNGLVLLSAYRLDKESESLSSSVCDKSQWKAEMLSGLFKTDHDHRSYELDMPNANTMLC